MLQFQKLKVKLTSENQQLNCVNYMNYVLR